MSSDDELRHVIRKEMPNLPGRSPHDVLAGMNPTLTRLARRRIATITASAVLVSGGVVGAAGYVTQSSSSTVRTTAGEGAAVGTGVDITAPAPTTASGSMDAANASPGDSSNGGAGTPGAVELTVPGTDTAPVDIADGGGTTGGGRTGEPPATPPDGRTEPDDQPPSSGPAPTRPTSVATPEPTAPSIPSPPSTTTGAPVTSASATTSTAPASAVRFDGDCGWVLADLTVTPPRIIEVVPTGQYRYRLEDPDGDRVVVQFTGGGEDCELIVSANSPDRSD